MSGGTSSDALAPLRECGFYIGSMHPLASISEPLSGAENLRSAFYCLEGDRKAVVRFLGLFPLPEPVA